MANQTIYEMVTGRIIELLAKGTAPWQMTWNPKLGLPRNAVSKKPYRGINPFMLAAAGYSSPLWITYKQAQEAGGHVKRGEKGHFVIFWKWLDAAAKDSDGNAIIRSDGSPRMKKIPFLRYFTVFNVEQTEGLPESLTDPGKVADNAPLPTADSILEGFESAPKIVHGAAQASYSPSADTVYMPDRNAFNSSEEYYATLFHELAHSTGHSSRLDRGLSGDKAQGSYGKEELVAEMTAAFLCAHCGIESTMDNSASYLDGWSKSLRGDAKLVVMAAAAAQKASDWILGIRTKAASEEESEDITAYENPTKSKEIG